MSAANCQTEPRTPAHVAHEDFEALKQFYSEAQLMELIILIAATNMGGRIGRALDLAPEGFSEGQFCVVPVQEFEPMDQEQRSEIAADAR